MRSKRFPEHVQNLLQILMKMTHDSDHTVVLLQPFRSGSTESSRALPPRPTGRPAPTESLMSRGEGRSQQQREPVTDWNR